MNDTFQTLKNWSDACYSNEHEFLDRFAKRGWILTQVSWNDTWMHFVYLIKSGQHISDQVEIEAWLEFYTGLSAQEIVKS